MSRNPSNVHDVNTQYINKIRDMPMLSSDEEFQLAKKWRDEGDQHAAQQLVESHLRLVMKIAAGYRGYGLPLGDLISEGHIGMMQALKNYDPNKGFRLSTYAIWWIKATIQEYILRTWSLVKMGSTTKQKKLFFKLRKEKAILDAQCHNEGSVEDTIAILAKKFEVSKDDILQMVGRLSGTDFSLNAIVPNAAEGSESEWQDWIVDDKADQETTLLEQDEAEKRHVLLEEALTCLNDREREILVARRLSEDPPTLEDLSVRLNISRERVRQLENNAFEKLKKYMA